MELIKKNFMGQKAKKRKQNSNKIFTFKIQLLYQMKMRPRQSWTPLKRIIGYCYDEEAKQFDLGYEPYGQRIDEFKKLLRDVFQTINCSTLQKIRLQNEDGKVVDVLVQHSSSFKVLRSINLSHCQIGILGLQKLLNAEWPSLKQLELAKNELGDEGLIYILRHQICSQLEIINIYDNSLTRIGLRQFMVAKTSNLRKLLLGHNKVGLRGVEYLTKSNLIHLEILGLWLSELTNQSIKHLCKSPWPNLKEIILSQNDGITTICLGYLQLADWKLEKIITSFICRLSINYFSTVVRPASHERVLKIKIRIDNDEGLKGSPTFINANVILTRLHV